jgi:Domain of unknown function (DUF4412)
MRRMAAVVLAAGTWLWIGIAAAETSEGVVHFKNTMSNRMSEFDYYHKAAAARMEIDSEGHGGKAAVIFDTAAQKMIMLMPTQKMAMEIPIPQGEQDTSGFKPENLVRTGKTQTILGYSTEQVLYKTEEGETEVWGAKGLGTFAGMHARPGQPIPAWVRQLQKDGFFPLLVIHKDKTGAERGRMEATKVEKKSLSDELFTVPADYKKFDRDSMMKGMGGPRPYGGRGE